jgi:Arc/MetJ-type ribon-helix-helix transcriptional regulator
MLTLLGSFDPGRHQDRLDPKNPSSAGKRWMLSDMHARTLGYAVTMRKRRVTITVDEALVAEASAAVAQGRVESVSAWVNEAMVERLVRDRRLASLAELVAEYEAEHGEITADELAEQAQRDRDAAAAARSRVARAG